MVVEEAEHVAEVVEKVAAVAEKVSADVAENLPEHTKLKTIALTTQHISQIAAHDAHCTQNFFHKVCLYIHSSPICLYIHIYLLNLTKYIL